MPILNSPFIQAVHEKYWPTLKYLDIPHRKLVIAFSAVPGAGKTLLSKEIAERYQGVRINKDDVWDIAHPLEVSFPGEDYQSLVPEYMNYLVQELANYPNGLLIIDRSLDRHYAKSKEQIEQIGYQLFLIRIDVPKDVLIQRLKQRHGEAASAYLERLDGWIQDFENAGTEIVPDFNYDLFDNDSKSKLFTTLDGLVTL